MRSIKKFMALCLTILIVFAVIPAASLSAKALSYDSNAAVEYARNHWNDGNGLCATFASNCLKEGGCTVWSSTVTDLNRQLNGSSWCTRYALTKTSTYYVYQSTNSGKIEAGDPILFYCNTCGGWQHAAICAGFDSSGRALLYGHNPAWSANKATSIGGYVDAAGHTGSAITVYSYRMIGKSHTHSYSLGTEAAHPHKVYMKCSCGDLYYTGEIAAMNESAESDYLKSAATCGSKAVYYKSCSVCGQASSDTFESGEFDYSNHVGSTYLKDQTNATCYKEGYTGDTCCSTCDRVVSKGHTIAKSAHNPASVWTADEVSHWKECQTVDCGNIIDKAAHSGGEATCVSKAVCSVCGGEYGEVNADNHKHTEVRGEKAATCCEEGYTGDTWCTDCNTKLAAGTQTDKLAHSLTVVEAKAATVTEQGNIKYYLCEDCGKYFSDAEGENEISLADTVIQKLPPEIIDGKNMTVNQGEKKSLSFRSNAAFADFIRVELDGKTLDESSYTKAEDGIAVTLNADFVATISAGKHTLSIVSESGSAVAEFTVKAAGSVIESPKTGEGNGVVAWSFAAVISLAAMGFALTLRKKRAR